MNDIELLKVKERIKKECEKENEINLFYFINENQLHINNKFVRLKYYYKISLTNFYKILTMIRNEKFNKNKINKIEVYL